MYIFARYILSLNDEISVRFEWFLNIVNVTVGPSKQNRLFVEIYGRSFITLLIKQLTFRMLSSKLSSGMCKLVRFLLNVLIIVSFYLC